MSKHTPGPWRAVRNEVHVGRFRLCGVNAAEQLGLVESYQRECENARLVAAAPDLLDAVRQLLIALENIGGEHVTGLEGCEKRMLNAYAAIEKATGEKA